MPRRLLDASIALCLAAAAGLALLAGWLIASTSGLATVASGLAFLAAYLLSIVDPIAPTPTPELRGRVVELDRNATPDQVATALRRPASAARRPVVADHPSTGARNGA